MITIIPAILAKSYKEFEEKVHKIESFTPLIHLDIADEIFVPNRTIDGLEEIKKIKTSVNFEVHLMVNLPEFIIDQWLETKAVRFLIHLEATKKMDEIIGKIHMAGKKVGAVLNPPTEVKAVESYLDRIDLVQFMTVNPGFQGSEFVPQVLEKVREFRSRYPLKQMQVDGGVNPYTIELVKEAGVDRAVVGSYIFKSDNVKEAMERLIV